MRRHLSIVLVLLCLMSRAQAGGDTYWTADAQAPAAWAQAGNWSNGVPTSGIDSLCAFAYIDNGGTALVAGNTAVAHLLRVGYFNSGNLHQSDGVFSPTYLYIADRAGSQGLVTYDGTSSSHIYTNMLVVGAAGAGRFVQTGGDLYSHEEIYVGNSQGGTGVLEMSGSSTVRTDWQVRVGYDGTGTFTQSGGQAQAYYGMQLGYQLHGRGSYSISDGNFVATYGEADTYIGYLGQGEVHQTGGHIDFGKRTFVGLQPGSIGTIEKTTGSLYSDEFYVGYYGQGSVIQSGGSTSTASTFAIGNDGNGVYDISGGAMSVGGKLYVGIHGSATLKVSGGDPNLHAGSYSQGPLGLLVSQLQNNGLSLLKVAGAAQLDGTWQILDDNAPFGTFDVLEATGGISGSFDSVMLPSDQWSWGMNSTKLWIEHVPEPLSISLMIGGCAMLAVFRRRSCAPGQ